ncbi:MAG: hypothetical protein ACI4S9_03690 [Christensenellales bacterium]
MNHGKNFFAETGNKSVSFKLLAFTLALAMTFGFGFPIADAFAEAEPTCTKQEVVYIRLNTDGSVSEICVVNIFDLSEDGQIVDYGDYTAFRNMTTDDRISYENKTVRIDTKAGKLYYEGTLSNNVIPWLFSFRYYIDGREYKAEEIAGKDGAAKITVSVRRNPDCAGTFFENYGLQISVTLDTGLCRNIVAEGATSANVGKNRQLTYTVLPGTEREYTITADVRDFEMVPIAINGIPLKMDVGADDVDTSGLTEETDKLKDAVRELDDGASELLDGSGDLSDGAGELADGAGDLMDGIGELTDATGELVNGASEIADGATDLNDGAADLVNGANDLFDGAGSLADGMTELDDGIGSASDGAVELGNGLSALSQNSTDLRNGAYTVFVMMTDTAENQLNVSLQAAGLPTVEMTPETYGEVIEDILRQLSEIAYAGAESVARTQIREQVENVVAGQIRDAIVNDAEIMAQISEEVESVYGTEIDTAAQNYVAMEVAKTYAPDAPEEWLQSAEGQTTVASFLSTAEGNAAVAEARSQIKAQYVDAAVSALVTARTETEEVQTGIDAAVSEQMETEEVRSQIAAEAENAVRESAEYREITALKEQLDDYNEFYSGLLQYTYGVDSAAEGASELKDALEAVKSGSGEILSGTITLIDGVAELRDGLVILKDGTTELQNGTLELRDGAISLYDGTVVIRDGAAELLDGIVTLRDGTIELYDGVLELKTGTLEFREETENIDSKLKDKINDAVKDVLGRDFEVVSFVSEKNRNVDSVQFVIQSEAVTVPEVPAVQPPVEEPLTFWQKLLRLFGLY